MKPGSSAFFGIGNTQVAVRAMADSDGCIEVPVDLPSGLGGGWVVLYSQALETASCSLSEVQSQVIQ